MLPSARLSFEVNPRISALIDGIGGQRFDDHYARSEWGWQHKYDLPKIIENFVTGQITSTPSPNIR
jgi:hypothetical protein